MKQALYFTLLLSGISLSCLQAQEQPAVRWKETARTNLKDKKVSYTDTLYLQMLNKEEANLRKGSFQYKGKIDKKIFDLGYLTYKVLKNKDEEIQLQDDEFIHFFSKETKDLSAADAQTKMAAIELPADPVKYLDPAVLNGNWEAYKRTGKKGPQEKIDYKTLIKTLSFNKEKTDEGYGKVTTNYIGGATLYTIKEIKAPSLVVEDTDGKEHLIKVWKLSEQELIMEDEYGIVYYMKRFQ